MRILSVAILTSALLLAGPFPSLEAGTSGPARYRGQTLSFYESRLRSASTRAEALRAIGSFGPQAIPALPQLIEALRDNDVEARIASAWALSQVGQSMGERPVKALTQVLADPDPKVRSLAAVALREAGPGAVGAVSALITALNDSAAYVRAPAADALGKIGPAARAAVVPLSQKLKARDEQVFVLRSLSTALGNIGPDAKSALPALMEVRKMVRVSYAAEEAIHKIKSEPVAGYW